jgi:hypothetical protein
MVKRLSCLPSKQAAGVRLPFSVLIYFCISFDPRPNVLELKYCVSFLNFTWYTCLTQAMYPSTPGDGVGWKMLVDDRRPSPLTHLQTPNNHELCLVRMLAGGCHRTHPTADRIQISHGQTFAKLSTYASGRRAFKWPLAIESLKSLMVSLGKKRKG